MTGLALVEFGQGHGLRGSPSDNDNPTVGEFAGRIRFPTSCRGSGAEPCFLPLRGVIPSSGLAQMRRARSFLLGRSRSCPQTLVGVPHAYAFRESGPARVRRGLGDSPAPGGARRHGIPRRAGRRRTACPAQGLNSSPSFARPVLHVEGHFLEGQVPHAPPHALPSVRPPLVPRAEEALRLVRLRCHRETQVLQLGRP